MRIKLANTKQAKTMDYLEGFMVKVVEIVNDGARDLRVCRDKRIVKDNFVDMIVLDWKDKKGNWKYMNYGMDLDGHFGQVKEYL